jgi:hypothetical protein
MFEKPKRKAAYWSFFHVVYVGGRIHFFVSLALSSSSDDFNARVRPAQASRVSRTASFLSITSNSLQAN